MDECLRKQQLHTGLMERHKANTAHMKREVSVKGLIETFPEASGKNGGLIVERIIQTDQSILHKPLPTFSRLKSTRLNNVSQPPEAESTVNVRNFSYKLTSSSTMSNSTSSMEPLNGVKGLPVNGKIHVNPKILKSKSTCQQIRSNDKGKCSIFLNRKKLDKMSTQDAIEIRVNIVENAVHKDSQRTSSVSNKIHINPKFNSDCIRKVLASHPPAANNPLAGGSSYVKNTSYNSKMPTVFYPSIQSSQNDKSGCMNSVLSKKSSDSAGGNAPSSSNRNVLPTGFTHNKCNLSSGGSQDFHSVIKEAKSNIHVNRKFIDSVKPKEFSLNKECDTSETKVGSLSKTQVNSNTSNLEMSKINVDRNKSGTDLEQPNSTEENLSLAKISSNTIDTQRKVIVNNKRRSIGCKLLPKLTSNLVKNNFLPKVSNSTNIKQTKVVPACKIKQKPLPNFSNNLVKLNLPNKLVIENQAKTNNNKKIAQLNIANKYKKNQLTKVYNNRRKKCVWVAPAANNPAVSSQLKSETVKKYSNLAPKNPYKFSANTKVNSTSIGQNLGPNTVLAGQSQNQSTINTVLPTVAKINKELAVKLKTCAKTQQNISSNPMKLIRKRHTLKRLQNSPPSTSKLVKELNKNSLMRFQGTPSVAPLTSAMKLDRRIKVSPAQKTPNSCLISVSRTKLIRRSNSSSSLLKRLRKPSQSTNRSVNRNNKTVDRQSQINRPVIRSRYSFIRNRMKFYNRNCKTKLSPTHLLARSVKTKYKLIQNFNSRSFKIDRHHLDRRKRKDQFQLQQSPAPPPTDAMRRNNSRNRKKSITIEGIRYHNSRLKLRRKYLGDGLVGASNSVISVRGKMFEIGSGGKTLKHIGEGPACLPKVYLGGVAFTQSKNCNTTLLRTNTHFIQHRLIQAKQRSIALLTKKLRKNNEPCPIYHRFGRCLGKEKGTCIRIHDPKHIAICKKFLKGLCEKRDCLLSHEVGLSKMPTCRHYLAGVCIRDNCPYLHVKLNSSAPICLPFLQGYCPQAEKCKKRHVEVCPEYETMSKCSKGKCCPYPHPKVHLHNKKTECKKKVIVDSDKPIKSLLKRKTPVGEELTAKKVSDLPPGRSGTRYYSVTGHDKSSPKERVADSYEGTVAEIGNSWLRKRPRLGVLPGFIPLDQHVND